MVNWEAVLVGKWSSKSSFFDLLKFIPGFLLVRFTDYYFSWTSRTFFYFLLVVTITEACYFYANLSGLDNLVSRILVICIGNNNTIFNLMYPYDTPPRHKITFNLSTVSIVLAANLPYILGYVDVELRPSFFNVRGFFSFVFCFLTEIDIWLFHWCPGQLIILDSYPQLYRQTCLRFLIFVGLIVFGGANMIFKAWLGDLVFHKHVLFLVNLCAVSYIRFHEKFRRLRRMVKKSRVVVPIDE